MARPFVIAIGSDIESEWTGEQMTGRQRDEKNNKEGYFAFDFEQPKGWTINMTMAVVSEGVSQVHNQDACRSKTRIVNNVSGRRVRAIKTFDMGQNR
jgi:hypothetical protein